MVWCVQRPRSEWAVSPHSLAVDFVLLWQLREYSGTFIACDSQGLWDHAGREPGHEAEFSTLCLLTLCIAGIFPYCMQGCPKETAFSPWVLQDSCMRTLDPFEAFSAGWSREPRQMESWAVSRFDLGSSPAVSSHMYNCPGHQCPLL